MNTFEFVVALFREANFPMVIAVVSVSAGVAVPLVVKTVVHSRDRQVKISMERDVAIRKLDVALKNGSVPVRVN